MKTIFISLLLVLLGCASKALADEASYYKMKADTEALFHLQGDLVDVKVAVDRIVDPSIDAEALRRKFNEDSAPLTLMMQGVGPDHEKLKILRRFLFEAGNWNQNRVMSYDFADPFAKISNHRFLTYAMNERLGNCVSMPMMMVLLGRRFGLKMTLSILPRHTFVKFTDELGRMWNLEATSGGRYTRDSHFREQFQFAEKAVQSGIYMSALTDEEVIALIAHFIPEWLMQHGNPEEAIAAYDVILQHYPNDIAALIGRGSSYAMILRRDFLPKYKSLNEMTPPEQQAALFLSDMNKHNFEQAEALGWQETDDLKSAGQSTAEVHNQQ